MLRCPRCQRSNPGHAVFCHHDGAELRSAYAAAPAGRLTQEFVFPSGRTCRTYDDLVRACQDEWDEARELVLAFALVNGRLPCPATASGAEAMTTPPNCDATYGGFLPAQAIGFQIVDGNGFAIDAWGNRMRYAVSSTTPTCAITPTAPHFTNAANLRANGISCQPNDLVICSSATGITATTCGTAAQVTNQTTVVALVFSTGKNGISGSAGIDEAANVNGDRVFVWHTPTPAGATNGEFDDQMTWITVGELYSKLISAGLLP